MATRDQLKKRLEDVLGTRLNIEGMEPPRLVRANSAFSKRQAKDSQIVEIDK
ncbi:hypothetical protein [Streptomyces sp. CBMA152]|uniref:hypothetical protein n=1 Tax=unclassified Streptomyces TaxID=2593676 RepID=UPI001660912F|nr:hypothetical protein [Streptomyces sp. CBMA152]